MRNKPNLVFVPGTLCTSYVFKPFIDSKNFNSITVDFSNHRTLTEMCASIKSKAGDAPIILVGFSMGGMVAFEFIRTYSKQVEGLILINSNCHSDLPGRKEIRDSHLNIATSESLTSLIRRFYLPIYFSDPTCVEANAVIDMADQLGLKVFEAQLSVLAERPDSLQSLSEFKQPTLIIGAENDTLCPIEHQNAMAKATSQSELHIIENAGHFAILEQPANINQIINQWVVNNYV